MVIATILSLSRLSGKLRIASGRIYALIVGEPRLLIMEGCLLQDALDAEVLRKQELISLLREQGIESTGQIRTGYLELSGGLGLLKYPKGQVHQGEEIEPSPDAPAGDDKRVLAAKRNA